MTTREEFFIEGHQPARILFRDVWPARGTPYRHTCDEGTFKDVLRVIDIADGRPFTGADLIEWTGNPPTQVYTALAFLKDRLLQETFRRHSCYTSHLDIELDGMTEFEALHYSGERR